MPYPPAPLTLVEAIDRARAEGFAVDVLAGFADHVNEILISLDTVDPDPTVSLRLDRSQGDTLISERSQSGPERWEYPFSISEYHDRPFLRVSRGGRNVDVPVLPAILGIVERYGLVEDLELSAPARVDRHEFERAIALLSQADQSLVGGSRG
jgi:hypothetical protein